ncbi:MAG: hypothetical protein MK141_14050 [Pseudoxanthomonas sp.]|uniref:hypothetical protein n=1 Tax=Pseudoxanthomonas sp. TaxID=1871049 RepID=UPI00258F18A3|nr:hypothetical protein [Pseudoxanthomonas sp.]MCH2092681.1 hypothetical protein [Pseudoxanthomonas sp.]
MPKKPSPSLVTDHAFVRYLERVLLLDVEQAKREILGHRHHLVAQVHCGRIKVHEKNLELVVRDGRVVTINLLNPERQS